MNCCPHCRGLETQFDQREAAHRLARYRRRGPERSTRLLLDALLREGVAGATLLDIGGGVGAVHHALLKAGASHATDVDAAPAYLEAARSESQRQGHAERVQYQHGDFVALAEQVTPADLVTLDRVICCYPDMPALVGAAAAKTQRLLGLVYPRDGWWLSAGVRLVNLTLSLQRTPFRIYAHSTAAIAAQVERAGLRLYAQHTAGLWQIALYRRSGEDEVRRCVTADFP